jgi:molybdenum cofactor cytidylyltransferase
MSSNNKERPAIVVLAAGRGRRFAGTAHKLEQSLGGSTVLASTLRHVIATQLPMVVVTTQALESQARRYVASRDVVVMPEEGTFHGLGVGASIAAGVSALPDAPGWVMLPADMPMVRPSTLTAVARALEEHPVSYAQHGGRRGHPVGFSAELYSELTSLTGDEGVRRLVARYPAQAVEVDDPGVLMGLDTVEDLAKLRAVSGGASTSSARAGT